MLLKLLEGLNEAQRDAVASESPHLLVLAGAGSGKTRVLVHRMAWMIDVQGHSPYGILSVTFTNKAAREMRNRIETMLGIPTRSMYSKGTHLFISSYGSIARPSQNTHAQ